jgi:hypothetical protein
MGAMEINKSGTTASDGLSGGVDRADTIRVGILVRWLSSSLWLNAEQSLDLRQCGQDALFRPTLYLFQGKLQQGRQVLIAVHTEPGAQRALGDAAVDLCAQLHDFLLLGSRRVWPKHVWAQLVTGDPSRQLDCDATFCWNATAVVPTGYRRRLDAKKLSKSLLATCRLNCSIEG